MDESHPSPSSLVDLRQQDFTKGAGDAIVKAAQVTFFNNFGPWFDPLMETYNIQVLSLLYCTLHYCAVLYCTVLYCTVLHYSTDSAVQCVVAAARTKKINRCWEH